ncbi:putative polyol transporter 3 [Fusarium oxysporum f. sp. rapae]|uniref:Putative polyol transporter 3 n=1 Tax=Fusarium oxysporum f. sp. rapae TaxID=485398 RepID=A0A8J5P4V9_FUSOX|nr:putative polyol transporter 3 [Fusarium oxysporum f. sp. rapae]
MTERENRESQKPNLKKRLESWIEKQIHTRDEFGNSLAGVSEPVLRKGIDTLCRDLPSLERDEVERAAEVAKNGNYYYRLSKGLITNLLPVVELTQDEKQSLVAERERLFSQRGMLIIICTVSLAAFLQGHVQSSINAMSLFVETVGIDIQRQDDTQSNGADSTAQWQLGGMNAIPFLTAAFPGAPLSLPVNYCLGRRGALGFSALLIIASSIGSAFAVTWQQVLGARIVGGVVMGIKALWVACGIMIGFVINFVIAAATNTLDGQPSAGLNEHGGRYHALQWIAAAPVVPSVLLFIAVCFCYESPRFYMRPGTPNYNLDRAFRNLLQVRPTRLQATRDLFLIWWSTRDEEIHQDHPEKSRHEIAHHSEYQNGVNTKNEDRTSRTLTSGLTYASLIILVTRLSVDQFKPLFTRRRLRNALLSSCVVALSQQLCGNGMFSDYGVKTSMGYSLGFVAPQVDSGDQPKPKADTGGSIAGIIFIYLFAAAYSPGLGPIPFTLASESFPLKNREAGASVAISINLFFAGLLTILLPRINAVFEMAGTLGFFAGLNIVAFVLIFFFVEETKQLTLEELDTVFSNPKSRFAHYQLTKRLPFLSKGYLFWKKDAERPLAYDEWAVEDGQRG